MLQRLRGISPVVLNKRDSWSMFDRIVSKEPSDRRPAGPARGIVTRGTPDGTSDHHRLLPPSSLAPFVAHFWSVKWSLRSPFVAETLPHPSSHIVVEQDRHGARAEVLGVHTARFEKHLEDNGRVFGIKFRPAAFHPWQTASLHTFTDRAVPISEVFGDEGRELGVALANASDLDAQVALAISFLEKRIPSLDPDVARVRDLVERMAVDRELTRVEQVALIAETDVRSLQRAFQRFCGVSPKWVLQRYRMHEAAEQLRSEHAPAIADLAAHLGYSDQAHFSRDFRRVVGVSPKAFREVSKK